MKHFIQSILLSLCFFTGFAFCDVEVDATELPPPPSEDKPLVYLIPVRQEIMQPQLFLLRRGVKKALEAEADAIVLLMDTPGGSVRVMQEMVGPIIDVGIPTYTLVEDEAISAGAIIAMSTDKIYMTPRSKIGDAMPVIMGKSGGYAELGEAEREKIESYMDAVARSIAQAKGRDEMLIRAMVRRDLEYILEDGTVISAKGNLLTLTNMEAERVMPDGSRLLSEGTVLDLDDMLAQVGLENAERIELIPEMADTLALWITRLAPMLLSLAGLLVYLEFQSPGIGWAGGGAALLFVIVVFGHNIAGLAGMEDLVIIFLGIALIMAEIFVIPGFGIAGLSGIALLCIGLIKAMSIRFPGNPGDLPGFENVGNLGPAVTNLSVAIIVAGVLAVILLRNLGENTLLGRKLVLSSDIQPASRDQIATGLESLVGQKAIAFTPLRPSGTVQVGGKPYDAISEGDYLDTDSALLVVDVRNHRLIVTLPSESRV